MTLKKNIDSVYKQKLCVYCGSCAAVCPAGCIDINDLDEHCRVVVDHASCTECGKCLSVCPGHAVDFPGLQKKFYFHGTYDEEIAWFERLYAGSASDKNIRDTSSSGGVVTALLAYLFDHTMIDGAVVLGFNPSLPWRVGGFIADSREAALTAAQSKYVMYPLNKLLKQTQAMPEKRFAFVGLPCQLHSIIKMKQNMPDQVNNILYRIGLYCMNNVTYGATRSLFKRFRIHYEHTIVSLKYRDGAYPGAVTIKEKNGLIHSLHKLCFHFLSCFFMYKRCLLCIDQTSEFSDIAVGDGWNRDPSVEDEHRRSVVIARTVLGKTLVRAAQKDGVLNVSEISLEEAKQMHSHVLDFKKKGASARITLYRLLNKSVPDYQGQERVRLSFGRYIMEASFLIFIWICSSRAARFLSAYIPLAWIDAGMKIIRKKWRKTTQSCKRQ